MMAFLLRRTTVTLVGIAVICSVVVNKSITLQSILILIGQYQSILSILSIIVQIASLVNNKPIINDTIIIIKHY
jgi:hypothetical protein